MRESQTRELFSAFAGSKSKGDLGKLSQGQARFRGFCMVHISKKDPRLPRETPCFDKTLGAAPAG